MNDWQPATSIESGDLHLVSHARDSKRRWGYNHHGRLMAVPAGSWGRLWSCEDGEYFAIDYEYEAARHVWGAVTVRLKSLETVEVLLREPVVYEQDEAWDIPF